VPTPKQNARTRKPTLRSLVLINITLTMLTPATTSEIDPMASNAALRGPKYSRIRSSSEDNSTTVMRFPRPSNADRSSLAVVAALSGETVGE
jgi:hypothetical protein